MRYQKHSHYPVKVLYIMGAGHSGSTILNALLGKHPSVEGVGELFHLPRLGWTNNESCACGNPVNSCSFWREVQEKWLQSTGLTDILQFDLLRDGLECAFLNGTLRPERFAENRDFIEFGRLITELYRAILRTAGKSVVVDSSKNPVYAQLLAAVPSIDLRVIHLVRDARGVAWSYRRKSVPAWRSALKWWRINAKAAELASLLGPDKAQRIHYEDLLSTPQETIVRISRLIDLSYGGIDGTQKNGFAHTVAGNRVRTKGAVALRNKDEWHQTMAPSDRWIVSLLAAWPLIKYGYAQTRLRSAVR